MGDASDINFVAPIKPHLLPAHGAHGQPAHQGALRRPAGDEDGRNSHRRRGRHLGPEETFAGHEAGDFAPTQALAL